MAMYALVHWEDHFVSMINLENVKDPRKPVNEYKPGEYIVANYMKKPYKARISEISEDRIALKSKMKDGQVPLHYRYGQNLHDDESEASTSNEEMPGRGTATRKERPLQPTVSQGSRDPSESEASTSNEEMPGRGTATRKDRPLQPTVSQGSRDPSEKEASTSNEEMPGRGTATRKDRPLQPTVSQVLGDFSDSEASTSNEEMPGRGTATRKDRPLQPTVSQGSRDPSEKEASTSNEEMPGRGTAIRKDRPLQPTVSQVLGDISEAKRPSSSPSSPSLHSKVRKLETKVHNLEKEVSVLKKKLKAHTDNPEAPSQREVSDDLLKCVLHLSANDISTILRTLIYKVFSNEEVLNCSRTGKKTVNSGETPRPGFDLKKLTAVQTAIMTKCSISLEVFKKKFDNFLKMERRKVRKSSD
ncbi:uncharacterized protein LOC134265830 isoform X1 [Saccostrea cucullata]|uniref:uncharacterized protein LOC134265830 isoform X1 n=1 Tax=Saccostrea cuccullata TaxID=36930 RepID=UPI002ED64A8A